ncbi:MAG TPA: SprT family zinc-dependent metalloprotease [Alphaproteobacteria bacterium]|nr:SprT family zinc-dependent metalloprotease [Alphaproteobacteria bacterium]
MSDTPDPPPGLTVRVNRRARRISLRLNAKGEAVLVLPHERLRAEGLRFASQKRAWLEAQRARQPERVSFEVGARIPVRGAEHRIEHEPEARDPVRAGEGLIRAGGTQSAVPGLVLAWLKAEARRDLLEAVARHAEALAVPVPSVTLRDPKTRWGSCSARKTLSLSWRLILAPPPVLDYVAAHEVAHLRELNHSARFWALVGHLYPNYEEPEAWLRRHGRNLHRYG